MENALLVPLVFEKEPDSWSPGDLEAELRELACGCGVKSGVSHALRIKEPDPGHLIGSGQASVLKEKAQSAGADTVIFGRDLSGTQQRNLEEILGKKTIDRTQLILDVFARRAMSNEGKIQVELAQLTYLLPRLAGKGIMLSRLGGGIGTRGPGEQKLETNRRRIRDKIASLRRRMEDLANRRRISREKRRENALPVIALVGYTNAGKSTLFNSMTCANVPVRDQMFSTLDPTIRSLILPNRLKILLVDTVGFLHLLPHHLIDAFKATLEEAVNADLLLHIVDASHPRRALMEESVMEVLSSLGADRVQRIDVYNKQDLMKARQIKGPISRGLPLCALKGEGVDRLLRSIEEKFVEWRKPVEFCIPIAASGLVSSIYGEGRVLERRDGARFIRIKAEMPPHAAAMIRSKLQKSQPI